MIKSQFAARDTPYHSATTAVQRMRLILRTLIGLLATCLLGLWISLLLGTASPAARTAASLIGERWYRLDLGSRAIGYYHSENRRNSSGAYLFQTELRFALSDDGPVTVQDSYIFAAAPPHELTEASHRLSRNDADLSVTLSRSGSSAQALTAQILRNGTATEQVLRWAYNLKDYLAVESWLSTETPAIGAQLTTRSPNLGSLEFERDTYELVSASADGYELRNPAMLDDTVIKLNRQLIPARFRLAGVFDLVLVSKTEALAVPEPLTAVSYRAPLDRPLLRPQELTRLELGVSSSKPLPLPERLVLTANPVVPATGGSYLNATLDYPSEHPRLKALLQTLPLAEAPIDRLEQLVGFVHRFIRYDTGNTSLPVLDVLRERRGDCTEYADLFTSLARAAGLPTRTVTGMAYTEEGGPALAFHAWNQVQIDGRWRAVDPTWDQLDVDATHWPLPADDGTALMLLTGQAELRLTVLATAYRERATGL